MVGGLIQDQKIGFAEQGLGQSSPGPLSSAGLGSRGLKGPLRQAQSLDHPVHRVLVRVPAQGLILVQQLGIALPSLLILAVA